MGHARRESAGRSLLASAFAPMLDLPRRQPDRGGAMPIAALRSLVGFALKRGAPILAVGLLAGCISPQSYIDPALPTVRGQDIAPVAAPKPVQLLYEFRTKGAPNARATEHTRPMVMDAINEAHMFGSVSTTPVPEGGV